MFGAKMRQNVILLKKGPLRRPFVDLMPHRNRDDSQWHSDLKLRCRPCTRRTCRPRAPEAPAYLSPIPLNRYVLMTKRSFTWRGSTFRNHLRSSLQWRWHHCSPRRQRARYRQTICLASDEADGTLQSIDRGQHPMRRLKRDPLERAFLRGYQYGIHGKSRELCPFTLPSVRQAWINGWREGRGDNWDGMTGTAGIHRLNELHAVGWKPFLPVHHARPTRAAG